MVTVEPQALEQKKTQTAKIYITAICVKDYFVKDKYCDQKRIRCHETHYDTRVIVRGRKASLFFNVTSILV